MTRLLVFRETLLPLSETFIVDHVKAVASANPVLAGVSRTPGAPLDGLDARTLVDEASSGLMLSLVAGKSRRFRQFIADLQPTVIHAHFLTDAAIILPYARDLGIPMVVTMHGFDATVRVQGVKPQWRLRLLHHRIRALNAYVARFIAVSDYIADRAVEKGVRRDKIITNYSGIPLTGVGAADARTDETSVMFIGRLVEKKGVDALLQAVGLLKQRGVPVRLNIVGGGPEAPALQALASSLGIADQVVFHGQMAHEAAMTLLRSAAAFVMMSRRAASGDAEGLGHVLLEAQAMGVPAITSNVSGTAEAVVDGVTGFTAPPQDYAAIADAIAAIITNPARRRELGRAAVAHVQENFDISKQKDRLLELYSAVE